MGNNLQHDQDRNEIYALVSFGRKQTKEDKNIGLFFPVYVGMVDAAMAIAPEIKIEWHGPRAWDSRLQHNIIHTLTERQVDGFVITVARKEIVTPAINAAMHKGIPVITFDADAPASDRLTFVGTNHFKAGYLAGKTMLEWLGGLGNILVATVSQADHLEARVQGFKTAIGEKAPQATVYVTYDMPTIEAGETLEQLSLRYRDILIRLLQSLPNIRGVFVTFARAGAAVAEAIEALHLEDTIQSLVFDVDERSTKFIVTDRHRAFIEQDMYLSGYVALILAYTARHAPEMPTKQDGRWRFTALQGFLAAHPDIPQDIAQKLRNILTELEAHAHEPDYLIDTGVQIVEKDRVVEVLVRTYEEMRESLANKIDALGEEIIIRKQTERKLRLLNEELEQRVADRTAQLEAAQAELLRQERLATLGKLTATVSHEIRNPLATIRASIVTVDRKTRGKGLEVERSLDRIERNITRCDNIIEELLDYTRMSDLHLQIVFFDDWLHQFLDEQTLPADIRLIRELTAGVNVSLDPSRFQRVLINLIDNACQAMSEDAQQRTDNRPLILRIRTAAADHRLHLTISDTGPGIPPEVMSQVFEPFYSTKGFGVGLGLSIVKEIIHQHQGDIEITSEVGQGTLVTLWLPVIRSV